MGNKPTLTDSIVPVQQIRVTGLRDPDSKRNIERFPQEFRFQFTEPEKMELVTNCDRFKSLKHSTSNPYVFTEQGISMLSAVLRSETAIKISIKIISAFVEMRHFIQQNASVFARMDHVERRQITFESKTPRCQGGCRLF
jgi:phage regulator Rha-like protein